MAKGCVSVRIEDGEGPSNRAPVPKRQRFNSFSEEECYDYVDEEEESRIEEASEEEELAVESEEEEESGAERGSSSPQTIRDGSISITLTDPKGLDCPICYESLTIPVLQCISGHIACLRCVFKSEKRCPFCVGCYTRCKAMDKVLESFKVSCQNTKYGCRKAFSYKEKREHEKTCPFVPCSCPLAADCNFEGSSKQLSEHLRNEHRWDSSLFILSNKVETFGNVVTLSRIGPPMEHCFYYELIAKAQPEGSTLRLESYRKSTLEGSTLRLQSYTKRTPKWDDNPPSFGFLLVPNHFSCISRKLIMKLRLWSRFQLPYPGSFPFP